MTAKNAYAIIQSGPEVYHRECSRDEFGDRKVLNKLADRYAELLGLSELEAMGRAVNHLQDADMAKSNKFGFKSIRKELQQEAKEARGRAAFGAPEPSFT